MKYQPETIKALENELARAIDLARTHTEAALTAWMSDSVNETVVRELGVAMVAANAAYTIASQIHASESQEHEFGIEPENVEPPAYASPYIPNAHETELRGSRTDYMDYDR